MVLKLELTFVLLAVPVVGLTETIAEKEGSIELIVNTAPKPPGSSTFIVSPSAYPPPKLSILTVVIEPPAVTIDATKPLPLPVKAVVS